MVIVYFLSHSLAAFNDMLDEQMMCDTLYFLCTLKPRIQLHMMGFLLAFEIMKYIVKFFFKHQYICLSSVVCILVNVVWYNELNFCTNRDLDHEQYPIQTAKLTVTRSKWWWKRVTKSDLFKINHMYRECFDIECDFFVCYLLF